MYGHATLHLQTGARLLAGAAFEDYDELDGSRLALLHASRSHITVEGRGVLDARGDVFIRQGEWNFEADSYLRDEKHIIEGPVKVNECTG